MAKPRVITRLARLLENADKVTMHATGIATRMSGLAKLEPGVYAMIPLEDVDAMVSALWREDARETRLEPKRRAAKRKASAKRKTTPLIVKRMIMRDGNVKHYLAKAKRKVTR